MGDAVAIIGWGILALAAAGTLYMAAAAITLTRFFARAAPPVRRSDAVTILKPLYGDEPRLADNLASFLTQHHDGPVQLLCGVSRADDAAIAAVTEVRARFPEAHIDLIVDATAHGANLKVANLINLEPHIAHDVIALSDSDIVAAPDYLARLLAALDPADVGVATVAYAGRGDAGFWSRVAAAGLGWQFLPGVVFGAAYGLAQPCMGSTVALCRETLDRIGGFRSVADVLADDHAIGAAVRALGLRVAVPPMLVTHASTERNLPELWRHELRWGATVRDLTPGAYVASVVAMPFPLALLAIPFHPAGGLALAGAALLVRGAVVAAVEHRAGARAAGRWLLPLRDCLSFAVFVASLTVRSVDWRGAKLRLQRHGRVAAEPETTLP
jgi:ceramide glucosyltransferase